MKLLYTVGLVLAAVICAPASAQVRPIPPATVQSPDQSAGITVSGMATQRLPATSARVRLMLATRTNATLDSATLAPLVEALVQAGADRSSIVLPTQFQSPGKITSGQISATFANPTADMMQRGIASVGSTIATMSGVVLNNAQVELHRGDCADAATAARKAAIDQARAKAAATAEQLGMHLGRVTAVRVNDAASSDGSCASSYFIGSSMPQSLQSPQDYVTIGVFSSVTITYAIR